MELKQKVVLDLPQEVEAEVEWVSLSSARVLFQHRGHELALVIPSTWVRNRLLKTGARFEYGGGMFYCNGYTDEGQLLGVCTRQEVGGRYLNRELRGLRFDPELVTPLEATR